MKKIVFAFLFLTTSLHINSQEPIAWYQFTAANFSNSYGTNNFTKSGNNATIVDGRDGFTSEAIDLNADILTASTPTPTNSDFRDLTISFWIKNDLFNANNYKVLLNAANTLNHPTFFNNAAIASQDTGYMVRAVSGGIQVRAVNKDQFNNFLVADTFTAVNINDNEWHHVAIRLIVENKPTSNPSFRDVNLLVVLDIDENNSFSRSSVVRISRSDADAINPFYKSGDFTIGGISTSNLIDKYNGEIDDLVIYDRRLANAEISTLNSPKRDVFPTNINGLINFYPQSNTIKYINGINVELTAVPNAGYGFTNWSRDLSGTTNPITLNINGNKDVEAIFSATATVKDINKIDFKVYPNPTTNNFSIAVDDLILKGEIYNVLGKKVMSFKSKKVNTSKLSSGMYLIKITTESGKIGMKKITKL
ncbi:T9SS type A sorting domain-containing protein [Polaribacter sp.]|uniref:T9SS type A sorting domain-containing protein n=1 Tax=Polaribacter sp. TaxID=1920175 RepID=UPI003F6CBFE7